MATIEDFQYMRGFIRIIMKMFYCVRIDYGSETFGFKSFLKSGWKVQQEFINAVLNGVEIDTSNWRDKEN